MVSITSHKGSTLRVKGTNLNKVMIQLNGQQVKPQLAKGFDAKLNVYEIPGVKVGDKVVIDYSKPTAIGGVYADNTTNNASSLPVYDLSGRLTHASAQGVLIAQGKKVIRR